MLFPKSSITVFLIGTWNFMLSHTKNFRIPFKFHKTPHVGKKEHTTS